MTYKLQTKYKIAIFSLLIFGICFGLILGNANNSIATEDNNIESMNLQLSVTGVEITFTQLDDYNFGDTGNELIFRVQCEPSKYLYFYELDIDSVNIYSGYFPSQSDDHNLTYSIDGYAMGTHTVEVTAWDSAYVEGSASDSFEVLSPTPPTVTINQLDDYYETMTGNELIFT